MTTAKISELTAAASSASTDLYEIETAGGASKKATAAQLLTYIEGAIGTAAFRALIDDASSAAILTTLGGAALASPTFTGTPAAPTAAAATNTTQIATTAFVTAADAAGYTPWVIPIDPILPAFGASGWPVPVEANNANGDFYAAVQYRQSDGNQNSYVEWKIYVPAGTWNIEWWAIRNTNNGIFTWSIDGSSVGTSDAYNSALRESALSLTSISVAASGVKLLRATMATKNASASNYYGQIYRLQLRRTA